MVPTPVHSIEERLSEIFAPSRLLVVSLHPLLQCQKDSSVAFSAGKYSILQPRKHNEAHGVVDLYVFALQDQVHFRTKPASMGLDELPNLLQMLKLDHHWH